MRNRKAFYILLLTLLLTVSILAIPAIADAGNFSGSSDYGGGNWGGSSDWGSSDWDSDYYGGGGGSLGIGIVVVIVVIVANCLMKKGGKVVSAPVSTQAKPGMIGPISALKEKDPNFSEAAIQEKIANLYIQMQQAWQGKDFEPMRPHMTDMLYNQFNLQLGELVRAGSTNYVERIAVLGVNLMGCSEDEVNDIILAEVSTRIVDYTTDDRTGELLSGSKTAEKFMTYEWTLIRSKGMTTPAAGASGTSSIHCPSCGAPLDINQSAKCPYCDAVINARDYDWVISSIRGISQRTAGR